jgi:hypothetical protein
MARLVDCRIFHKMNQPKSEHEIGSGNRFKFGMELHPAGSFDSLVHGRWAWTEFEVDGR